MSNNNKKFDIFLSYNWDSKTQVKSLYKKLSTDFRYKVWLDDVQLDSRNLFEQLIQGINDSRLFLCCITKKYSQSDNCIREINYASINKLPLVIVMLEKLNINELGSIGFIIASLTRFNFYNQISNDNVWSGEIFDSMMKSIQFNLSGQITKDEDAGNRVENQVKFYDNGRYEGDLTSDGCINGKGTFFFNDGQKYVGEWLNYKKTGLGIWYHVNGDRYEGEFLNDLMHGKGVYYFKSGNKYDGDWVEGKRTGKGNRFSF
jgi:hypothetical protein